MFAKPRPEQVATLVHELGHIFGLRHFFANVSELELPSEVFGEEDSFTIMNYGHKSKLTERDRADLVALYSGAWLGELEDINGTAIRFFSPYSVA